ncbi:S8 family serine peptidase [Longimicrobium sp.]|uniref:S8 family serine peptidase n=1 Tax=Longimicrobium sp. TaxID=2029185 RepID=UPI003B3AF7EA
MNRYTWLSALLVAGTLAGCADVAGPAATGAPRSPAHSLAAGNGQHVVVFKGNGIPAGFAAQVAALGGTVTFAHAGVGFAIVSGLGDAAAAQVGGMSGVSGVQADEVFQVESTVAAAGATVELGAQSQADPATAAVAILDSGLDYDAPDLNGLVDLSRSASFVPSDDAITAAYFPDRHPVNDYNGHGTNVATQVSSKAVAIAGVTSRTTLIGVKVLGANNFGSLAGVLAGITYAADQDADIANLSLGGGFAKAGSGAFVGLINRTLAYANRQGMLVVVSAGNGASDMDHDGNTAVQYCGAPHVVCVSSVGPATGMLDQDAPAFYTNFGRSAISVAAPGGNADAANGFPASARPWGSDFASRVWSLCARYVIAGYTATGAPILTPCAAGNRLNGLVGTSQATPHVTGLAALLMAEHGTRNQPSAVKHAIERSAVDLGATSTDPYFGRGRIDVARALGL